MIKLNLETKTKEQEIIKQYLEENVSQILADKINNGVKITKNNKTLINKKDLNTFMKYACEEARKPAEKGANCACIEDKIVFAWAIHYFEEDTIEGNLYNEDGTEFKTVTPKPSQKVEVKTKKVENKQPTLFDFMSNEKPLEFTNKDKNIVENLFDEKQEESQIIQHENYKVDLSTGEIVEETFDKETAILLSSMLEGKLKFGEV